MLLFLLNILVYTGEDPIVQAYAIKNISPLMVGRKRFAMIYYAETKVSKVWR
jgi:hypothetical protein